MSVHRLFDRFPEPLSVVGADLVVRRQNRESRTQYGDGAGERCYQVHFDRDAPCPGCLLGDVLRGKRTESWYFEHKSGGDETRNASEGETTVDRPEGSPAAGAEPSSYYEITLIPLTDARGEVTEMVEILRDATMTVALEHHLIRVSEQLDDDVREGHARNEELRVQTERLRDELREIQEAQASVVQTEKMASLGRLAAGLTHEIHTPVGTIAANLDVLRRRLDDLRSRVGDRAEDEFAELDRVVELHEMATERILSIARSLRVFAHLDRSVEERVDPHEGIEAALALLTHELKAGVRIARDYGDLPPLLCRPDAMNQVYMNILQNAVQAMSRGPDPATGELRIVTRAEGDEVVLEFHDDGVGLSPDVLDKVFEPGYTSKPRGVGTGLGLAIAYRTVQIHGGRIEIESTPGEHTVFRVVLPRR